MTKVSVALLSIGLVVAATAARPMPAEAASYEALSKAKVSLGDAVRTAEKQSGGKAIEAEFEAEQGGVYEVEVVTGDALKEYAISASDGAVREVEDQTIEKYLTRLSPETLSSAKTSLVDAIDAAEKEVAGRAAEADVDRAGDTVEYEIEIVTSDGSTREVSVSADGVVR